MTTGTQSVDDWLSAVRGSSDRLAADVGRLSVGEFSGPSYDSEWTVAQVLSHLGSGAEIFTLMLEAGAAGEPAPGVADFEPIWERWNARLPEDQVAGALRAERAFHERLGELDPRQRRDWHISFFGNEQKLSDLLRFRLSEHALHTWDVEVPRHPAATLAPDATELLTDTVDQLAAQIGRAPEHPVRVAVSTTDPDRRWLLVADGTVELRPTDTGTDIDTDDGAHTPQLHLPAEALIRLVAGRLDPQHTPAVEGDADLDVLRRIFPGF